MSKYGLGVCNSLEFIMRDFWMNVGRIVFSLDTF